MLVKKVVCPYQSGWKANGRSSSSSSSCRNVGRGLAEPCDILLAPDVPDAPDVLSSTILCVERRERTCGACARARDGDDDVDRPGTFERRRLGGVTEVWMSDEELISSASCVLGSRIIEYLARLTVLSREEGRFFTQSMSFVFSRSEI